MFDTLNGKKTNKMKKDKFIRLFTLLFAALPPAGPGFALIAKKDADEMLLSEPGCLSINPTVAPDADGNVQVAPLPSGVTAFQALTAAASTPAADSGTAEAANFTISNDVPLPVIQRGGGKRESKYPFDKLELANGAQFGGSFFVPNATTKGFASTINAQNRKYKGDRRFTVRTVTENNVTGVRVWRVAPKAPKAASAA